VSHQKKKVLVADDVSRWQRYVEGLLRDRYDVAVADDFDNVIQHVNGEEIDAVILDFLMPGSPPLDDGCRVCNYLRRNHPKIEVLIYTGAWMDTPVSPSQVEEELNVPVIFKPDPKLRAKLDELLYPDRPNV